MAERNDPALSEPHEFDAASLAIVAHLNALPAVMRREGRRTLRNFAARLRRAARLNANRSHSANTAGAVLGGGLLTGSVVLFATTPATLAMVLIATVGAIMLAGGLAAGHILNGRSIEQDHRADLVENMIEELDP